MNAHAAPLPSPGNVVNGATTGDNGGEQPTISERLAAAGIVHRRDARSLGPYAHSLYRGDEWLGSFTAVGASRALDAGRFT